MASSFHPKLAQAVALNVFNAGCVIGADSVAPADLDLASLHVTIEDDGEGPAPTEGEGLTGMRRRLELLGGQLDTGRGEKGVRLVLRLDGTF